MEARWASARPGCPRELPTADEVRAWLDESPEVEDPVFLADLDNPRHELLAYPVTAVPALILAALSRWGCDPQFSAEDLAMHAAPWSLLEPTSGFPNKWHKDSLKVRDALDSISVYKDSSPSAPTRDELNDASGPDPNGKRYGIPQDAPDLLDQASLITFVRNREPWATWLSPGGCLENAHCELTALIMAVLSRHSRPAFAPIPVSERLPGPEDCCGNPRNGRGEWCWGRQRPGTPAGTPVIWRLMMRECLVDEAIEWAPWWAFPIPTTQEDSDNG